MNPVLKCHWAGYLSAATLFVGVLGLASCVADRVPLKCAPFARERSGVQLYGAAADWWQKADGRYIRTRAPVAGSVLVFRRSSRLSNGHVAVVTRVLSERQILVTHANWVHHRVSKDMPVTDVSPNNNWYGSGGRHPTGWASPSIRLMVSSCRTAGEDPHRGVAVQFCIFDICLNASVSGDRHSRRCRSAKVSRSSIISSTA